MTEKPMDLETYNQLNELKGQLEKLLSEYESVITDAARDFWKADDWYALFRWKAEANNGKLSFTLEAKNPHLFQKWHSDFGRVNGFAEMMTKLKTLGLDWSCIDPEKVFINWKSTNAKAARLVELVADGKVNIEGIETVLPELDRQEQVAKQQVENIKALREAIVSEGE